MQQYSLTAYLILFALIVLFLVIDEVLWRIHMRNRYSDVMKDWDRRFKEEEDHELSP